MRLVAGPTATSAGAPATAPPRASGPTATPAPARPASPARASGPAQATTTPPVTATAPATAKVAAAKAAPPKAPAKPGGRPKKARKSFLRRPRTYVLTGCCLAAAGAGVVYFVPKPAQAHAITVPSRLPGFVLEPSMVASAGASSLRSNLVASSGGEATHVQDAVYEDVASATGTSAPQIVVFVGGHLAGSASAFIGSLTQALPGAYNINPGALHGQAACVPSQSGRPAECAWADNDTFGVLVSPSLTASALSAELRQMRPHLEHVVR
jgi:hypothetical protein